MSGRPEGNTVLNILNFAGLGAASLLARDVESLGYDHRVESGSRWLRKAGRRRDYAKVVLLGADPPNATRQVEIVERIGDRPWVCILTNRGHSGGMPLMRAATEFLQAPWTREELEVRLERFTSRVDQARQCQQQLNGALAETGIIGRDPAFRDILETAIRIAASPAPIIIEGETGTGKELVARLIHRIDRRRKAFVAVNCGCLPPDLVENELFGHVAGAYTGASNAQTGLVAQADGGTLFLDEIDTLPQRAQVALLRFLQQGEMRPVGAGATRAVSAKVLAASNRPLAGLVAEGAFRADLYFRLNVLNIALPPLRERRGDIADLVRHFLDKFGAVYGRRTLYVEDEVLAWLMAHDLPGNVRQLENLIHRAVATARGVRITLHDIAPPGTVAAEAPPAGIETYADAKGRALKAFERRYLTGLMQQAGGNVTAAAAAAGKERRALGRLLKKHRIGPHWSRNGGED